MCGIRNWGEATGHPDYIEECPHEGTEEVKVIYVSEVASALAANNRDYAAVTIRLCPACLEVYQVQPTTYDRLYHDAGGRLRLADSDDFTALCSLLQRQGPSFSGEDVHYTVREWFSLMPAPAATEWIEAGFWSPETAGSARKASIAPDEATERLEDLPEDDFGGGYVKTTQDRIDAACNGDVTLPW